MEYTALFSAVVALSIMTVNAQNLHGDDQTVLTGSTASLSCKYDKPDNFTGSLLQSWMSTNKNGTDTVLFFGEARTAASDERKTVSYNDEEMTLNINDVKLEDEMAYKCILHGLTGAPTASVQLTVNQHPEDTYVENYDVKPIDGTTAHIATCISKGSKPAPLIEFTDSSGNKIESLDEIEHTELENGLFDSVAKLNRVFYKEEDGMKYTCRIRHNDNTVITRETTSVSVRYETTAKLQDVVDGERRLMQEGERLEVSCIARGNPIPVVNWIFIPDANINITMQGELPEDFIVSADGRTMIMESVTVTNEFSTNNGTFQCKASNGIGNDVILSFKLGVFAAPVTTVPTTPEMTPVMEPRSAGSDAAVIGGVVAVAVFVLIVAVVLVAKYFMSHKGTYHTNEIKSRDLEENRNEDEHPMVDEDDELGEKKRTEYFM